MKNISMIFNLVFLLSVVNANASTKNAGFDKYAFYSAMACNDMETVNNQLSKLKASSISEKEAYEGALLMKKAGMVTKVKEKLSLFKAGRLKLESSIKIGGNAEFNFLRLIIQEHAPKAVDYRKDIENDVSVIRSNFKTLAPAVQQAINDYSKKSKVLKSL